MTRTYYRPDLRDECEDVEVYDRFDNSDEEMEQRREDEEAQKREDLDKARSIVAKLIRKEFDSLGNAPEVQDTLSDLVMVAKLIGEDELASEMSNDIKLY